MESYKLYYMELFLFVTTYMKKEILIYFTSVDMQNSQVLFSQKRLVIEAPCHSVIVSWLVLQINYYWLGALWPCDKCKLLVGTLFSVMASKLN